MSAPAVSGSSGPRVVVVGGGLAGIAAALYCADRGARVTVVERRRRLGGLTWSFERNSLSFDNGQHVFLRCCTAYRGLLDRIGAADQVHLQRALDLPVLTPGGRSARIARTAGPLPSPLHLAASLLAYRHLTVADRARLGRAVRALRRLDLDDPALDSVAVGEWLARHGQSAAAVERLWDLVVLPTVNLGAAEASLALGAKVFRTGLLDTVDGADIGWSAVPLAELHGAHAARALDAAGVEVLAETPVQAVDAPPAGAAGPDARPVAVTEDGRRLDADAVIVALPHTAAADVLPAGAIGDVSGLGYAPIVNVHLVFDRTVTDLPMAAAIGSPVQFVFDHTEASGVRRSATPRAQCLVVSLSDARAWIGARPDDLVRTFTTALRDLFPAARAASLVDGVVSRERTATFRGVPGTARMRPGPRTAAAQVFVAGAWCATGWPATMESAVRSGNAAGAAAVGSAVRAGARAARPLEGAPR